MGLASVGTNTYVTSRQTCPCRIPCAEPLRSETICPVVSIFRQQPDGRIADDDDQHQVRDAETRVRIAKPVDFVHQFFMGFLRKYNVCP